MGLKDSIESFLAEHTFYREYAKGYVLDMGTIRKIKESIEGVSIKVFYGDWCPDCKAQLPPFINILLALEKDDIDLEFIGLGRGMTSGFGKAEEMNIMAVPTFIFFREGKEIGRIIERPKESMEKDIAEIIE